MAFQLKDFVDPKTTAVLCMEMQRGIVGDLSSLPQLFDAVKAGNVPAHIAALMQAARDCVARLPASHAESVLQHTRPVIGAVVSSEAIKAGERREG